MKRLAMLAAAVVCAGGLMFIGGGQKSADAKLASAVAAQSFAIDTVHSQVVFRLTHLNVAAFWGRINDPTGSFTLDGDSVSFDIKLDMNKIDTAHKGRDDHLRRADFFNSVEFPSATFKSTGSTKTGANTWDITGDLTIRGITKPITAKVTKIGEADVGERMGGYKAGIEAEFTINRMDFGVSYGPNALGQDVRIIVALEGARQ